MPSELKTGTSGAMTLKTSGRHTTKSIPPRFPRMEHRRAGNLTGATGTPSFFREGRLVLRGGKEWTPIHKCHAGGGMVQIRSDQPPRIITAVARGFHDEFPIYPF